jgi:Zn-dependent membrane protease YugP
MYSTYVLVVNYITSSVTQSQVKRPSVCKYVEVLVCVRTSRVGSEVAARMLQQHGVSGVPSYLAANYGDDMR